MISSIVARFKQFVRERRYEKNTDALYDFFIEQVKESDVENIVKYIVSKRISEQLLDDLRVESYPVAGFRVTFRPASGIAVSSNQYMMTFCEPDKYSRLILDFVISAIASTYIQKNSVLENTEEMKTARVYVPDEEVKPIYLSRRDEPCGHVVFLPNKIVVKYSGKIINEFRPPSEAELNEWRTLLDKWRRIKHLFEKLV